MAFTTEPLIKKSAAGPSIPLNTVGPLTAAQLRASDMCHFEFVNYIKLEVGASGLAQGTYDIFTVPQNTYVRSVTAVILEDFDASCTITIGDGDQAAGYAADNTDWDPGTVGSVAMSVTTAAGAYKEGRLYASADTIDIVLAGADATQGAVLFIIHSMEVDRLTYADFS